MLGSEALTLWERTFIKEYRGSRTPTMQEAREVHRWWNEITPTHKADLLFQVHAEAEACRAADHECNRID